MAFLTTSEVDTSAWVEAAPMETSVAVAVMPFSSAMRGDVDDVGRRRQALLHGRDERLAAGHVAALGRPGEQRSGLGEVLRTVVVGLVHAPPLQRVPAIAAAPAAIDLTMFW